MAATEGTSVWVSSHRRQLAADGSFLQDFLGLLKRLVVDTGVQVEPEDPSTQS